VPVAKKTDMTRLKQERLSRNVAVDSLALYARVSEAEIIEAEEGRCPLAEEQLRSIAHVLYIDNLDTLRGEFPTDK
jgi:transcriptional regulator with XRE-family HTH domain